MRRDRGEEQENPLNLCEKGHWKFPMKFIVILVKSVLSRIQSMLGTVRPSRDIQRLNSKFFIFLSNRQYNMKMWSD